MEIESPRAIYLLATLLLAACSSAPTWDKAGATEMDFKRDSYDCERDQPVVAYCQSFDCIAVKKKLNGMMRRCMESKGWVARQR